MFELMLMRHAKSDWQHSSADINRPLSKRGRLNATDMGKHLSQINLVPDKVLMSDSQRAQQTANLLLKSLSVFEKHIIIERALYLADRKTLCRTIKNHVIDSPRLMVIAHNPGMDDLVNYLASEPPLLSKNGKLMVTCAVAVFQIGSLDDLDHPGQGKLLNLIRPGDLS